MRRSRSPLSLALTGGVLVAAGLAAWAVPVARAQTVAPATETGWWSRQPLAQPVPDGGFEVGWALEQEQSSAAVRFASVPTDEGTVLLVLKELGGGAPDQGRIRVCATDDAWTAANPGAYADRPEADCDAGPSVELGRDAGALEWLGDITSLASGLGGSPLSLVVQPLGKPLSDGAPTTFPFTVQVSAAELRVDTPFDAGSGATEDTVAPDSFDLGGGITAPDVAFPDTGGSFTSPALPPAEVPAAPAAPPAAELEPEEQAALGPVRGTRGEARPWGRMLVLTPISAGLGTLAAAGRRWHSERALLAAGGPVGD
jgi:hypothetical protein